jgi:hypothetical protein
MCNASFQPVLNKAAETNPTFKNSPFFQAARQRFTPEVAQAAAQNVGQDGETTNLEPTQPTPPSEGGVVDRRSAANKSRTILEGPVKKLQGKTMLGT